MAIPNKLMEAPAPVDDGWWQSVLAEEERHQTPAMAPRPPKSGTERSVALRARPQEVSKNRSASAAKSPKGERSVVLRPQGVSKGRSAEQAEKHVEAQEKPSADWTRIQQLFHSDEIISLTVTGFNRGGLLVDGDGLHGFVPLSHLVELAGSAPADRDQALGGYVGRAIQLKVIECAPEDGRVVFSERAAQAEPGRRAKIFDSLQSGQKVKGLVTNVTDFGAFVDLGGVEGLIHISELSWGRVGHPSQVVALGQEVEAMVMDIAAERCRVALSLKRLLPNPWLCIERDFAVDQVVPATVTAVLTYGAFARLDVGVEGLIHASEMPIQEGGAVKDFLHEGQRLDVRVLHVDAPHQRMGLSLRLDGGPIN
jgi:small subunit ribosomal protein S1